MAPFTGDMPKLSQAEIARRLKLSRNTVANAVHSESPPRYERAPVAPTRHVVQLC